VIVLIWITEGTWQSAVDAARDQLPADGDAEIRLLYVTDDHVAGAAHGAFAGLLGRGRPGRDPGDRMEELAETLDEDPAAAVEERAAVLEALRTLPDPQRNALVLVDMEGYPVEEAAKILGCAVGTIKSRCARGRAKLLPLLRHLRSPDPPGNPADGQGVASSRVTMLDETTRGGGDG
jgi:RNA polymerase sigma factor (sigma-70 family)